MGKGLFGFFVLRLGCVVFMVIVKYVGKVVFFCLIICFYIRLINGVLSYLRDGVIDNGVGWGGGELGWFLFNWIWGWIEGCNGCDVFFLWCFVLFGVVVVESKWGGSWVLKEWCWLVNLEWFGWKFVCDLF